MARISTRRSPRLTHQNNNNNRNENSLSNKSYNKNFLFLFVILLLIIASSIILLNLNNATSMTADNLTIGGISVQQNQSDHGMIPKQQQQQQQRQQQEQQNPSATNHQKADDESDSSSFMLSCLKNALHNELPMSKTKKRGVPKQCQGLDIAYAHHWDSGNVKLWSPAVEYRLKPMDALDEVRGTSDCRIWEVGAHKKADDSRALMKKYNDCHYHAFEPIPQFTAALRRNWAGESRMTIHGYGIGKEDSTFEVSDELLKGQATYIADNNNNNKNINSDTSTTTTTTATMMMATIKSFDFVLQQAKGIPTLLHMNCEGCEWEFLFDAKKHGFINKVPVIQIGWHNYGEVGLGARVWQLCEIRQLLSETHTMTNGLAFGWDRWELKT